MRIVKNSRKLLMLFMSLSLIIASCNKNDEADNKIYQRPPKEPLDSLNAYFKKVENYSKKEYLPSFYAHFNEKLKLKQWEKAAQMLFIVGNCCSINDFSDSLLLNTHFTFLNQHAKDISNKYITALNLNIGDMYYYKSQPQKSFETYKKNLTIPPTDYYTLLNIAQSYKYLSFGYVEVGKSDSALLFSFKGLDIAQKLKDTTEIGAAYDVIATIYNQLNDFDNCNLYCEKAIKTLKSTNFDRGLISLYLNQISYMQKFNSPQILAQIDTMYRFYKKCHLESVSIKINANSWYAYKLIKENKISEAKKVLDDIKLNFINSSEKFLYGNYLYAIALYDKQTGGQTFDISYYRSAIEKYKKVKMNYMLSFCYHILKQDAIKRKDFQKALYYSEELEKTNAIMSNDNLKQQVKYLDKKFQTQKKEQEIAKQKATISQKNAFIYALFAVLTGLLLAMIIYYLWQKQKSLKQDKINNLNYTQQLLSNIEDERKRIASDLHDSISHELLNLKMNFNQDFSVVRSKIDSIINDIRSISRNLHPIMFDRIGLTPNIEQLTERIQIQNDFLISTDINYSGKLSSPDELQIYRIIQEALSNIIKYANAHAAKISISEVNEMLKIEIKDNGKGFNVKEKLNSQNSFGLHNIIERSRAIGGIAKIQSSEKGTDINIEIPIKKS